MVYPPAHWQLKGYAIQTLHLLDIERARLFVPPALDIIAIWPGKTLGGVYLARYGSGSALEYHELIAIAGLVRHGDQWGGWVSDIYVDHPDSVAGGREIWGLPKELAQFEWQSDRIIVRQGNTRLCQLSYNPQGFSFPLHLKAPVLSIHHSQLLRFFGEFDSRLRWISGNLEIPAESAFSKLGFSQPWLTFFCEHLNLVAGAPDGVATLRQTAGV